MAGAACLKKRPYAKCFKRAGPISVTLRTANCGKLVNGHGGQLAVGLLDQHNVAKDLVVVVAMDVQAMPLAFHADDGSAGSGRPAFLSDGDKVLHFDTIADLEFVDLSPNVVLTGGHGTAPGGVPDGHPTHPGCHYCAERRHFGKSMFYSFCQHVPPTIGSYFFPNRRCSWKNSLKMREHGSAFTPATISAR
jgi:hypothetical protein